MAENQISIKKAALLNASSKYLTVILQIVYMAIVSRILTPTEFGIVAVIHVFIVFFQLFADMGFGTAVIQNKTLTDDEVNQIFTFTIYLGFALMVLFAGASFIIAEVYNDRIYVPLGFMLSLSLLLNSFNMIPNSIMLKNKRFYAIAIRTIVVALISYTVTIGLALVGFGVYALVANSITMALALFLWNEISTKLKFKRKIELATLKKVWGYSIYQFASQAMNYFNRNLDNLLIGKFFSATDLGYYNKSYTLAGYPIAYLPGVITPVLHPILSEHQDDKEYIYNSYVKLLKFLSLLGCFGGAFCFFAGKEIILLAFGNQWEASILPFRIISLSIWMQILTHTLAPIYQSTGNTKLQFKSVVICSVLIISSIIIGAYLGSITSVAICVSLAYALNFFISFAILIKDCLEKSFLSFLSFFSKDFIIFFILVAASIYIPINVDNILISFLIKLGVFSGIFYLLLLVFQQYKYLMVLFKK